MEIKKNILADILNTLKIMRNDIQSINTKLLIQVKISIAILPRLDSLSVEISSLKKENEEIKKEIDNIKSGSVNPFRSLLLGITFMVSQILLKKFKIGKISYII
jgi:hypothetical protein